MAWARPGVHGPPHRMARRAPRARPRHAAARRVARRHSDLRRRLRGDGRAMRSSRSRPARSCVARSSGSKPRVRPRRSRASSSSRCTGAPTTTAARTGTRRSCRPRSHGRTTRCRRETSTRTFFRPARQALVDSNLGPWTSQVEWGLGQWEINLEYRQALEMADRHILFKLAMRDLAAANGMAATFMAKPFPDTTGSSCHLHLSLVDDRGGNVVRRRLERRDARSAAARAPSAACSPAPPS